MYLLRDGGAAEGPRVQLLGSGAILREVLAAAEVLKEFGVTADVWSVTSFTELRKSGLSADRWNALHPGAPKRESWLSTCLGARKGPVVAATDYVKLHADQVRAFLPRTYRVLGTDGFGRSDYRARLRRFFEVDRASVAVHALVALAEDGAIPATTVEAAIKKLGLDPEKPEPTKV
jgi:pyruvate dehydrogenase E1 component